MKITLNKKSISNVFYALAVFLSAMLLMPAVTRAQEVLLPTAQAPQTQQSRYPEWAAATSTRDSFYVEGPSEPASVRFERTREYRRQSRDLDQRISSLGGTANAMVLMPVLFGIGMGDFWPNFGDPRSGGRTHEGEDIMAVKGTPIVSPTTAIVIRTGVGPSEGNYVYTANPGGETFVYMHLDRIGEGVTSGTTLTPGSLIGYVGNTGNASGGAAHLHFEIHNSSGSPTDPFPRLTGEFTLQDKITYLSAILARNSDSAALAVLLVTNFRGTFTLAQATNVILPFQITNALASVPINAPRAVGAGSGLPAGDLDLGSAGSAVVSLQTYLIRSASGSAATRLAGATATGNFGPITQAALIEFQLRVGITPASGYYGPSTRAYIAANPVGGTLLPPAAPVNPVITPAASSPAGVSPAGLTRDLYQGLSGEDVRLLQRLLNANGYAVASAGLGSDGNETNYFGPATLAAVVRFQLARGIVPAVGRVGPLTRAALSTLPIR